jgi:hypothetical protein
LPLGLATIDVMPPTECTERISRVTLMVSTSYRMSLQQRPRRQGIGYRSGNVTLGLRRGRG